MTHFCPKTTGFLTVFLPSMSYFFPKTTGFVTVFSNYSGTNRGKTRNQNKIPALQKGV